MYKRLSDPDTNIMFVSLYIRIPSAIIANIMHGYRMYILRDQLRNNLVKPISNIDHFPTFAHLIRGYASEVDAIKVLNETIVKPAVLEITTSFEAVPY